MQITRDEADGTPLVMSLAEAFDGHNHFRNKMMLRAVAVHTARNFPSGAVAMPNLPEPITTPRLALDYKGHILKAIGLQDYRLIMTGYLTEDMDPAVVVSGFEQGAWQAMKFYPRGLTTNSHGGVEHIKKLAPVFEAMERVGMRALFHGEASKTESEERVDIYDREARFFDTAAAWLINTFPTLPVSFEHGSTRAFVSFMVEHGCDTVVGTITPQHLMFDRNDFFADGPDVHLHCYPVLKRWQDKEALRSLATAGYDYIFAGTDSAPHPTHAKERACGCAGGVFTAHAAPSLYAQVFEEEEALGNLEKFLSLNGPRFHGLKPSTKKMQLRKEPWTVDAMIDVENGDKVRPLFFHEDPTKRQPIQWKLAG